MPRHKQDAETPGAMGKEESRKEESRNKASQPAERRLQTNLPSLGKSRKDYIEAITRAICGVVPYGGTAIGECVVNFMGNLRIDRVEQFLTILYDLQENFEDTLKKISDTPLQSDLFNDALSQAQRAVSKQRMEFIAKCFADGIDDKRIEYIETKRILRLLEQLDDAEIVFIAGQFSDWRKEWYKKHEIILEEPEEDHRKVMYKAAKDRLVHMGLLWYANRSPEDKYRIVTPLGRLLLKRIGVLGAKDEPLSEITIEME